MYSTLCETESMGDVAKILCLLERRGLHPLTRYIPCPVENLSRNSETHYIIELHTDELETGRKILISSKREKFLHE